LNLNRPPRILLVYPSCFYGSGWVDRLELKASQLLLASYLVRFFPVEYADFEISLGPPSPPMQINRFIRKIREFLESREFDILALSCWASISYLSTLAIARLCRELYPEKLIVVGGYHPTGCSSDFLLPDQPVDYIVKGEGESALREIAENYRIWGRPAQPQVIDAPALKQGELVGHDWSLTDELVARHYPDGLRNIYIYLSRGCPFGCSFCMEPLKDRTWRAFSPEQAAQETFAAARRYNSKAVAICDACFGKRSQWRKEYLRVLRDAQPDFWLILETRPEYIDDEDIELLAGMKVEIQLGLESAAPRMLRLMKKTKQPLQFLSRFSTVSHKLSAHGIIHRANLIFNHPGETHQTLSETYAFIDAELKNRETTLLWAAVGYMHFPGCELYANMDYYQQEFGASFRGGEWWKKEEDQFQNSIMNLPSADITLDDFFLWRRLFEEREEAMKATLSDKAFRFAEAKYCPHWRDDARYGKN